MKMFSQIDNYSKMLPLPNCFPQSFYLSDEEDDVDGASLMNSEDDEEDRMLDVSGNNGMERSEFTSE